LLWQLKNQYESKQESGARPGCRLAVYGSTMEDQGIVSVIWNQIVVLSVHPNGSVHCNLRLFVTQKETAHARADKAHQQQF
jgi:hypothetical protein